MLEVINLLERWGGKDICVFAVTNKGGDEGAGRSGEDLVEVKIKKKGDKRGKRSKRVRTSRVKTTRTTLRERTYCREVREAERVYEGIRGGGTRE